MTDLDHEAERAQQLALANDALSAPSEESLQGEPSAPLPAPAAPEPPAPETPPARTADHVPLATYLEQREQAREYARRLAEYEARAQQQQQQQRQPAPDPFMNPDQFTDSRIQQYMAPIVEQVRVMQANNNLNAARAIHGQEVADQAYQEFDRALPTMSPYERAAVMQAQNPFVAAVEWHQRHKTYAEVGNDPVAYRERLLQEALQDETFLNRAREAISARLGGRYQPQTLAPPRNEAGQFTSQSPPRKALPSVNRAGSGQAAMSSAPPMLEGLDLARDVLNMSEEPR